MKTLSNTKKRKGQITALPLFVVVLVLSGLIIMIGGHIWSVVDDTVADDNTSGVWDTQIENISGSIGEGLETFGEFFPVIVVMVVLGIMISLFIGRGGMMSGIGGGL